MISNENVEVIILLIIILLASTITNKENIKKEGDA